MIWEEGSIPTPSLMEWGMTTTILDIVNSILEWE